MPQIPYIKPLPKSDDKKPIAAGKAGIGAPPVMPPRISGVARTGKSAPPLPQPAMLYQYGGKDYHKDKEKFNAHLKQVRTNASQNKDTLLGWYDQSYDEFYSRGISTTQHEQAHRFDIQVLGNPSIDGDFAEEASKIPSIQDIFSKLKMQYPVSIEFRRELYATLWEIAKGDIENIPASLRKFYTNEWSMK